MNKVFLIGNLTRDAELTETNNGVSVCKFSIAVNRSFTGADGERKVDYFNCVAWRGLGENVARYCRKGSKVAVSGTIETRNYEDSQGIKHNAIDIIAQDVEFLTPKQYDGYDDAGHDIPKGTGRRQPNDYVAPARQQSVFNNAPKLQEFDDDDDIPF